MVTIAPEDALVVTTTCGSAEEAEDIAEALVEGRLAACVQLSPMASVYAWKGDLAREQELLLTIKTRRSLFGAVEALIRERHSYETPEILAVGVVAASTDYLTWLAEATDGAR